MEDELRDGATAEIALTVRSITDGGYAAVVLERLARLARRAVSAEQACLLVRDLHDPRRVIAVAGEGLDIELVGRRFAADEGIVGSVLRHGEAVSFPLPDGLPEPVAEVLDPSANSASCVPIGWNGGAHGAFVTARTGAAFGPGELSVLAAIADVAAAALEHAEHAERGEATIRARVETLTAALELRDSTIGFHVAEVVDLARRLGERMGLSPPALAELEFAARLHDVGKIAVPDPILRKDGPLTPAEWDTMRRHPEWGSGMLAHIPGLEAVAIVVRFHHERWDGMGYPDGLEGERIPLASRIVAVCDAYNAMTADRLYRGGATHDEAIAELTACAGGQFDPRVVEEFLDLIESREPPTAR